MAEFCLRKGYQPVVYESRGFSKEIKLKEKLDRHLDTKIALEYITKNYP